MKLLRFGPKGAEKPGMLDNAGRIRDLSGVTGDFAGAGVSLAAIDALRGVDPGSLPLVEGDPRIGSVLADCPNFWCIGLNYARHAAESGYDAPKEPVVFNKATSALSGPFDPVIIKINSFTNTLVCLVKPCSRKLRFIFLSISKTTQ